MAQGHTPFSEERGLIKTWLIGHQVKVEDPLLLKALFLFRRWAGTGSDYDDEDAHLTDLMRYIGSEAAVIAQQRSSNG